MRSTEFIRSYTGKWTQTPCGYKSTSATDEWYQSKGTGRYDLESIVKWVYKVLDEEDREYTHYITPRHSKPYPKLPDEYPKGNLADLLTFDTES